MRDSRYCAKSTSVRRGRLTTVNRCRSLQILQEKAEKNLDEILNSVVVKFDQTIERQNYDEAYALIADPTCTGAAI